MPIDSTNALITVADFKKYISQSTGSTSSEERYVDIINSASMRFNSYTGRLLKARDVTEYIDGDGGQALYTKQWPINDSATDIDIRVDTNRSYSTSAKIGSTGIIIYSSEGKIILDGDVFESGYQSVKIVYNAGYSTIPYDLAYACKEYCRLQWKREQSNHVGLRSQSVEGGSITYEQDMPWSVEKILKKYKKRDSF